MPNPWARQLEALLGGSWPRNYLAFDTETLGPDPANPSNLITQVGWAQAHDGIEIDYGSVILDWTAEPWINVYYLEEQLAKVTARMAEKGHNYPVTIDRMRSEGLPPSDILPAFKEMLLGAIANGDHIAGHNAWHFDLPLIHLNLKRACDQGLEIPGESVLDTGMVDKARMLEFPVSEYQDIGCLYSAVYKSGRRARCSLDGHCNEIYNLNIDANEAHDAGVDSRAVVRLVEAMRAAFA